MGSRRPSAAGVALAVSVLAAVSAVPTHRDAVPNGRRARCKAATAAPGAAALGHGSCAYGGGALNAFGEAFRANGLRWTSALCEQDSDADGATNGEELGDPCCAWQAGATLPSEYLDALRTHPVTHPGDALDRPAGGGSDSAWDCPGIRAAVEPPRDGFFLPGEPQRSKDFRVDGYRVPAAKTVYADATWAFDDPACEPPGRCYLVGVEAVDIAPAVHHFVLRGCPEKRVAERDGEMVPHSFSGTCGDMIAGWSPGKSVMKRTPEETSCAMFFEDGQPMRSLHMQVHYQNPAELSDLVDTSVFRIYYTTVPRAHDDGTLALQRLSFDQRYTIPPRQPRYFVTKRCKLEDIGGGPITVYGVHFHAHQTAHEFYARVYRPTLPAGGEAVFDEPAWRFNNQLDRRLLSPVKLEEGDTLQATCVYNTTTRAGVTTMGPATTDEMCWVSLYYYPRNRYMTCEGDVWMGALGPGEGVEDVAEAHPADRAPPLNATCDAHLVRHLTTLAHVAKTLRGACGTGRTMPECSSLLRATRSCAVPAEARRSNLADENRDALAAVLPHLDRMMEQPTKKGVRTAAQSQAKAYATDRR